jgi:hypothetical protein
MGTLEDEKFFLELLLSVFRHLEVPLCHDGRCPAALDSNISVIIISSSCHDQNDSPKISVLATRK